MRRAEGAAPGADRAAGPGLSAGALTPATRLHSNGPALSLLVLQMDLDLVVDRVRAVLLVLRHGGLPRDDLHLHRARQKQLLLLLLVLQVDAVDGPVGACHAAHHLVVAHQVVLHLLGHHAHHQLGLVVVYSRRRHRSPLRLLLVVLVQLLNVEGAAALVDVDVAVDGALNLNCLRAVALLRVQLATVPPHVHRLDLHHLAALHASVATGGVVGRGYDRLPSRVEPEVGLVHQLLVEGGVDGCVVVGDGVGVDLGVAVLEELVQDALLLVVVDVHPLALDSAAFNSNTQPVSNISHNMRRRPFRNRAGPKYLLELLLALGGLVVVAGRVASLHALAVLGGVGQG